MSVSPQAPLKRHLGQDNNHPDLTYKEVHNVQPCSHVHQTDSTLSDIYASVVGRWTFAKPHVCYSWKKIWHVASAANKAMKQSL